METVNAYICGENRVTDNAYMGQLLMATLNGVQSFERAMSHMEDKLLAEEPYQTLLIRKIHFLVFPESCSVCLMYPKIRLSCCCNFWIFIVRC